MSLESLLMPIKWADEQVLRQYTKLAQNGEKKGISKYVIANGLNGVAKLFFMSGWVTSSLNSDWVNYGISLASSIENGHEFFVYNHAAFRAEEKEIFHNVKDSYVEKWKSIFSAVRFPILATGIYYTGIGISNFYQYFFNGDSSSIPTGIEQILLGAGLLSWSSAMYIRESDPKLLQKDPLWKKAYNWLKEKAGNLAPTPLPNPAPVQYQGLEECL